MSEGHNHRRKNRKRQAFCRVERKPNDPKVVMHSGQDLFLAALITCRPHCKWVRTSRRSFSEQRVYEAKVVDPYMMKPEISTVVQVSIRTVKMTGPHPIGFKFQAYLWIDAIGGVAVAERLLVTHTPSEGCLTYLSRGQADIQNCIRATLDRLSRAATANYR